MIQDARHKIRGLIGKDKNPLTKSEPNLASIMAASPEKSQHSSFEKVLSFI